MTMPNTTDTDHTTDIRVPPGTVPVLEEHVLGPHAERVPAEDRRADADAFAASAAWEGLKPAPRAHYLRFDLTSAGDRAGAVWLFYRLKDLTEAGLWTLPEPVVGKRDVLRRIAQELYEALRAAEVAGVEG